MLPKHSAEDNVFWENTWLAIGVLAGYIGIRGNIDGSYVGVSHAYVQTGDIRCNLFFQNENPELETHIVPSRVRLGEDGNEVGAPGFLAPDAGDFRLEPGTRRQTPRCLDGAYDAGELLTRLPRLEPHRRPLSCSRRAHNRAAGRRPESWP